jgi:hypothetical protein
MIHSLSLIVGLPRKSRKLIENDRKPFADFSITPDSFILNRRGQNEQEKAVNVVSLDEHPLCRGDILEALSFRLGTSRLHSQFATY